MYLIDANVISEIRKAGKANPVVRQFFDTVVQNNHRHALDKLIAATALIHGLTGVTRNVGDFENTGIRLLNPFIE